MGGAIHGCGHDIILYVCDIISPNGQCVHVLSAGVSDNEPSLLTLQRKKGLKHSTPLRSGVGGAMGGARKKMDGSCHCMPSKLYIISI